MMTITYDRPVAPAVTDHTLVETLIRSLRTAASGDSTGTLGERLRVGRAQLQRMLPGVVQQLQDVGWTPREAVPLTALAWDRRLNATTRRALEREALPDVTWLLRLAAGLFEALDAVPDVAWREEQNAVDLAGGGARRIGKGSSCS